MDTTGRLEYQPAASGDAHPGVLSDAQPLAHGALACQGGGPFDVHRLDLNRLRLHNQRGRPFGTAEWTAEAAKRMDLESSMGDRGRPKKKGGE